MNDQQIGGFPGGGAGGALMDSDPMSVRNATKPLDLIYIPGARDLGGAPGLRRVLHDERNSKSPAEGPNRQSGAEEAVA
eukprot:4229920-Pyramimonas_sp.AAC.1